jgi:hypothetical protein
VEVICYSSFFLSFFPIPIPIPVSFGARIGARVEREGEGGGMRFPLSSFLFIPFFRITRRHQETGSRSFRALRHPRPARQAQRSRRCRRRPPAAKECPSCCPRPQSSSRRPYPRAPVDREFSVLDPSASGQSAHLAEHDVLSVQPRSDRCGDEKLRSVGWEGHERRY